MTNTTEILEENDFEIFQKENSPDFYPASHRHIKNGGIEQAFFEIVNQDGLLSEKDKSRLAELQGLPHNRKEVIRPAGKQKTRTLKNNSNE